ncbi:MAG: DNA-3-methyladenine glycosylase [Deinococcales bacterium]
MSPGRARSGRGPEPLPRSFYARPADELARALLGQVLSVERDGRRLDARIVETEAYLGEQDLACHASRGRTRRTETLYGPPGTAYVYLIYGMYHLFNVVALAEGDPHAVLVRAVEPLTPLATRTDGPGRLTRALGIDLSHNGLELFGPPVSLLPGPPPADVAVAARIGVDYAGDWSRAPLRFLDAGSRHVSRRARAS